MNCNLNKKNTALPKGLIKDLIKEIHTKLLSELQTNLSLNAPLNYGELISYNFAEFIDIMVEENLLESKDAIDPVTILTYVKGANDAIQSFTSFRNNKLNKLDETLINSENTRFIRTEILFDPVVYSITDIITNNKISSTNPSQLTSALLDVFNKLSSTSIKPTEQPTLPPNNEVKNQKTEIKNGLATAQQAADINNAPEAPSEKKIKKEIMDTELEEDEVDNGLDLQNQNSLENQ
jgi:hypothetical protein